MPYKVSEYAAMFSDRWRMDPYVSALKKFIKKDTIVMDIGAGTGIFSLLACRMGAKKVYAVEPSASLNVCIQAARSNNYSNRIEFINKKSEDVKINERVDLIISDLRGILPLLGDNIATIADAKKRFLKTGGKIIPQSDTVWAAIVSSPRQYKNIVNNWDNNFYKLKMNEGKRICLNNFYFFNSKNSEVLTEKKLWQKIEYGKSEKAVYSKILKFKCNKKGTAHGIICWFNSNLARGVNLINDPDVRGSTVYGRAFFPFLSPLKVTAGDRLEINLTARLVNEQYIWSWKTGLYKKFENSPAESFSQSTFHGKPISPENLNKRSQNYRTEINPKGLVDLEILKLISNRKSIKAIGEAIFKKYPERFKNKNNAIAYVGDKSVIYSK